MSVKDLDFSLGEIWGDVKKTQIRQMAKNATAIYLFYLFFLSDYYPIFISIKILKSNI